MRPAPPSEVAGPQVVAATGGYVAVGAPLLTVSSLRGADGVDIAAKFLLRAEFKKEGEEEEEEKEEEEEEASSHSSSSTRSPTSLRSSATSSSSPTCAQLQFIYDFWTFLLCSRDRYPQCKLLGPGAVLGQSRCAHCCATAGAWSMVQKNVVSRSCSLSKVVDFLVVPQRQIPLVLPVSKITETPQLQYVSWSIPLLCRSCLPCPLLFTTGAQVSDSAEIRGGAAVAVPSRLWTSP